MCVQYIGGYDEYTGECSVHRRVTMMQVGDIMIHVGGYHEYIGGCSVHWGFQQKSKALIHFLCHMNHDVLQCTQGIPVNPFALPHESWCPPMCSRYPSDVPSVLMISPTWIMISLRCTEHPSVYWTSSDEEIEWGMRWQASSSKHLIWELLVCTVCLMEVWIICWQVLSRTWYYMVKRNFEINHNEHLASRVKHSFLLDVILLVAPANHSGSSSRAIMYNVCSVHQGIRRVHWGMLSTSEGYHDASGGYYDSCGRISWVHWGMFSTLRFSI